MNIMNRCHESLREGVTMKKKCGAQRLTAVLVVLMFLMTAFSPALAKVGRTYVSRVNGLRVRTRGMSGSPVIGKLHRGQKVIHRGSSKGWWLIETSKGLRGYVFRTYLKPVEPQWIRNANYRIYKTRRAVVRRGPRPAADKVGTIQRGTVVKLTGKQGNWGKIRVGARSGWVQLKFLSFIGR
jgi:uncharacterized protein YgiM (DUF1202 family)